MALVCPQVGMAETSKDLVELLPTGYINWTKGVLEAKGCYPLENPSVRDAGSQQLNPLAHQLACENALNTLKQVRMDATRNVAHTLSINAAIGAKVKQMADTAPVVQEVSLPNGTYEVTVRVNLLGGFAQLMLPEEIKQVEPVKAMPSANRSGVKPAIPAGEVVHTGLIVDARGIGAKPAMVPLLVDENGKQVYGSAFVSREYAVQFGMCEYVQWSDGVYAHVRVAPNPLKVKGLRTLSERKCDIVISNADAANLRDASAHLGFLKECRVIIVLD